VTSFGKNAVVKGAEEQRSRGAEEEEYNYSDTLGVFPYIGFFRTTTPHMRVDKMRDSLTCHHCLIPNT